MSYKTKYELLKIALGLTTIISFYTMLFAEFLCRKG